jgi:hypothetical protein
MDNLAPHGYYIESSSTTLYLDSNRCPPMDRRCASLLLLLVIYPIDSLLGQRSLTVIRYYSR